MPMFPPRPRSSFAAKLVYFADGRDNTCDTGAVSVACSDRPHDRVMKGHYVPSDSLYRLRGTAILKGTLCERIICEKYAMAYSISNVLAHD